jgi:hypothetical protein
MIDIHEIPFAYDLDESLALADYNIIFQKNLTTLGTEGDDVLWASSYYEPIENPAIPKRTWDAYERLDASPQFSNPLGDPARVFDAKGGDDIVLVDFNLDAKDWVIANRTFGDLISWRWVAGTNQLGRHSHWVQGAGRMLVNGFEEGDTLMLRGHTVSYKEMPSQREDVTRLAIYSDQGGDGMRNLNSHDFDVLGMIRIQGDFDISKDLQVNNHAFNGVREFL